jgi:TRAP-type mannitol/chloroaromatic compound transport system permease small subunit
LSRLLILSRAIDSLNGLCAKIASVMVLLACLVSAGNALIRYGFSGGSNAWLEVQWHLFAGMVMLGSAYALSRNGHVRVDVLYGGWKSRTQAWVDIFGFCAFLLPVTLWLLIYTWPMFTTAWLSGEVSANAGGLPLWPAKLMLPLGFGLLALQGVAEIIKRVAYLRGELKMDLHYEKPLQ